MPRVTTSQNLISHPLSLVYIYYTALGLFPIFSKGEKTFFHLLNDCIKVLIKKKDFFFFFGKTSIILQNLAFEQKLMCLCVGFIISQCVRFYINVSSLAQLWAIKMQDGLVVEALAFLLARLWVLFWWISTLSGTRIEWINRDERARCHPPRDRRVSCSLNYCHFFLL